jgi:hypothetical protein
MKEEIVKQLYKLEQQAFDEDIQFDYEQFSDECKEPNIVKYIQINGEYKGFLILRKLSYPSDDFFDFIREIDHQTFSTSSPIQFNQFYNRFNDVYYIIDIVSFVHKGMAVMIGSLKSLPEFVVFHAEESTLCKQLDTWFSFKYILFYISDSEGHYNGNWKFVIMRRTK